MPQSQKYNTYLKKVKTHLVNDAHTKPARHQNLHDHNNKVRHQEDVVITCSRLQVQNTSDTHS